MKEFKTVVASVLHGGVYVSCSCFKSLERRILIPYSRSVVHENPAPRNSLVAILNTVGFLSQRRIRVQLLANSTSRVAVKSLISLAFCRIPQRIVLKFRIPGMTFQTLMFITHHRRNFAQRRRLFSKHCFLFG